MYYKIVHSISYGPPGGISPNLPNWCTVGYGPEMTWLDVAVKGQHLTKIMQIWSKSASCERDSLWMVCGNFTISTTFKQLGTRINWFVFEVKRVKITKTFLLTVCRWKLSSSLSDYHMFYAFRHVRYAVVFSGTHFVYGCFASGLEYDLLPCFTE